MDFLDVHPGSLKHVVEYSRSTIGKSEVYIVCPFCGTENKAYLWSLAGCGKRCQCGAKHTYYGYTIPPNKACTRRGAGMTKKDNIKVAPRG
jgi:hypothetical protein